MFRASLLLPIVLASCVPPGLQPAERVIHVREVAGAGCDGAGCRAAIAELLAADAQPPVLTVRLSGSPEVAEAPPEVAAAAATKVADGLPLQASLPAAFASGLPPPARALGLPAYLETPLGRGLLALVHLPSPPGDDVWTVTLEARGQIVSLAEIGTGPRPRASVIPVGPSLAIVLLDLSRPGFTVRDALPLDLRAAAARALVKGTAGLADLTRAAALDPGSADVALAHARALAAAGEVALATAELSRAVGIGGEPLRIRARRVPELAGPAFADVLRPREVQGFDRAGGR